MMMMMIFIFLKKLFQRDTSLFFLASLETAGHRFGETACFYQHSSEIFNLNTHILIHHDGLG